MTTTSNVLTVLGNEKIQYREMDDNIGMLCTSRATPKMITRGLEGFELGL